MDQWALITGASAGIGRELARLFAADQFNLVLVARNGSRLKDLGEELQTRHGISVKVLARDLSCRDAPAEIFEAVRETPGNVLVNHAGFGAPGPFVEAALHQSLRMR